MSRARNGWKQRIRRLLKWIDGRGRARGRESEKEKRRRGRGKGRKGGGGRERERPLEGRTNERKERGKEVRRERD
jgi:hypothetical protein